jgi:hypothetical protein
MVDVMAELREQLADTDAEEIDIRRLMFVRDLRDCADRHSYVTVTMAAPVARMIATDLEELTMLRVVPPTGEDG